MSNKAYENINCEFPSVSHEISTEIPPEVLSSPSLLFLFYRIEQIFGIKPEYESLKSLNDFIENKTGSTFVDDPAAYECVLTSREEIFIFSKYLTVNETYFFREGAHFRILTELLPELSKLNRTIHICSAACSTGCEPYSIAMLLDYHIENGIKLDYTIDAFDVSGEAIETAKNARFTANSLRNDGTGWKFILDAYITKINNEIIISGNIKRRVRFFPHNIMCGLDKQYDIIFFRNALIYFSSKNKNYIINNLSTSLLSNGYLFLGISETSFVKQHELATRYSSDAFYFQKLNNFYNLQQPEFLQDTPVNFKQKDPSLPKEKNNKPLKPTNVNSEIYDNSQIKQIQTQVSCVEINKILEAEEGKPNAHTVLKLISNKDLSSLSGGNLAASVVYFLNIHDFNNADIVLSYLEIHNNGPITKFLRGEYLNMNGNYMDAEKLYNEAISKDRFLWPAFYRIANLASEGNQKRYEHKIRKTIESIQLSKKHDNNYECFLGGFSSDYFLMILKKKLS
jgi:chemotaxis protein methyltransferase CheR